MRSRRLSASSLSPNSRVSFSVQLGSGVVSKFTMLRALLAMTCIEDSSTSRTRPLFSASGPSGEALSASMNFLTSVTFSALARSLSTKFLAVILGLPRGLRRGRGASGSGSAASAVASTGALDSGCGSGAGPAGASASALRTSGCGSCCGGISSALSGCGAISSPSCSFSVSTAAGSDARSDTDCSSGSADGVAYKRVAFRVTSGAAGTENMGAAGTARAGTPAYWYPARSAGRRSLSTAAATRARAPAMKAIAAPD
mmetsp:Transcript_9745/g.18381  ORF Transcript_9745/g.18381 Transcript_9745/m.18381 type:complete len:257 (+) Transcript_9745:831-1601(+)